MFRNFSDFDLSDGITRPFEGIFGAIDEGEVLSCINGLSLQVPSLIRSFRYSSPVFYQTVSSISFHYALIRADRRIVRTVSLFRTLQSHGIVTDIEAHNENNFFYSLLPFFTHRSFSISTVVSQSTSLLFRSFRSISIVSCKTFHPLLLNSLSILSFNPTKYFSSFSA